MRKVLVVGLGKSGVAACRLLAKQGDIVFITEMKDDNAVRLSIDDLIKDKIVSKNNFELGAHTKKFVELCDLVVVSPGVKPDSLPIKLAEEKHIPVISELELGYSMCPAPVVAVTGTSGKTTVTTLIGRMLAKSGRDAIVCGNIGNPFCGEIDKIKKNSIVVLEVSSFQLERIRTFKPKASIILNITENHLDRHSDMDEYVFFKSKIYSNQNKDSVVFFNGKDAILRRLSQSVHCNVEFFDEFKDFGKRLNVKNDDYLAGMSMAALEGVREDIMMEVISSFKGIEHRLEHVAAIKGVDFINDSKATTVSSVEWALKSLEGRIILIMGGRYKGGDFGRLKELVEDKVHCVIAIGEARPYIKQGLGATKKVVEENGLKEAVRRAFASANKGDKILLSPGCSSFDMFQNYEERGRTFKDIVKSILL